MRKGFEKSIVIDLQTHKAIKTAATAQGESIKEWVEKLVIKTTGKKKK